VRFTPITLAILTAAGCGASRPQPGAEAVTTLGLPLANVEMTDVSATFDAGGIVRARLSASLSSRIVAPIVEITVRPGETVRRGQVVVTLDARDLAANRARAAATLTAAERGLQAAEAERQGAGAAETLASTDYHRIDTVYAKRSATPQERDAAKAALDGAVARNAAAAARVAEAQAALAAARAAADAAAATASYGSITAPFDGLVAERLADPGVTAAPGVSLLVIEDTSAFRVECRVDEARGGSIHVGDAVDVRIDDRSRDWLAARVGEIARVDPSTHTFAVKIDLPPGTATRSGAFATARFRGAPRPVLTVPSSSLVRRGQLAFVFVVPRDGKARLRDVSTGEQAGDRTEVLAGVQPGETIVVAPPSHLRDGTAVRGSR
jgi:multidrug efflux pump subunit AcrA (membrane-fusion protein)